MPGPSRYWNYQLNNCIYKKGTWKRNGKQIIVFSVNRNWSAKTSVKHDSGTLWVWSVNNAQMKLNGLNCAYLEIRKRKDSSIGSLSLPERSIRKWWKCVNEQICENIFNWTGIVLNMLVFQAIPELHWSTGAILSNHILWLPCLCLSGRLKLCSSYKLLPSRLICASYCWKSE